MGLESADQLEAAIRLNQAERMRRLRAAARGYPWLSGRLQFVAALACGVAWVAAAEWSGLKPAITWVLFIAGIGLAGVLAWLDKRISAIAELVELQDESVSGGAKGAAPAEVGK